MKFVIQYRHKGHNWNAYLEADDWEDAAARKVAIGFTGELMEVVDG